MNADPAVQGRDVTLQRGAAPTSDYGHLMARADLDDFAYIRSRVRESDRVRRHAGMVRGVLAVPLAHRSSGRQPVAQQLLQRGDHSLARGGSDRSDGRGQAHSNPFVAGVFWLTKR